MVAQPTEEQVARHLEAFLLWLFGSVMFTSTHGNTVNARWIPIARAIAEVDMDAIPQLSWGSAVLCGTYQAVCDACIQSSSSSILAGMPLLVQLWSFERFQVGRPLVQPSYYTDDMYGGDEIDRPTLWDHFGHGD